MEKETSEEIFKEIDQLKQDAGWYLARQRRNLDVRFCYWDGKSPDGRKRREYMGKDPFPFEGASDTEIRLSDWIINKNAKKMRAAFARAKMGGRMVSPMEAGDAEFAGKVTTVLKWMLFTRMEEQLAQELKFAAQWRETHGCAVMGVDWHEELGTELKDASMEGIEETLAGMRAEVEHAAAAGQEVPQEAHVQIERLEELILSIQTGDDENAAAIAMGMYPGLSRKEAKRASRNLRQKGYAEFPVAYVQWSLPRWTALRVMDDVFFPSNTCDIQKASFVARREWLTEEELKGRALVEDWDDAWVEQVLETKGQSAMDMTQSEYFFRMGRGSFEHTEDDFRDLVEVWTVDRKRSDERGISGVYRSVLHPGIPELLAKDEELLNYPLGLYPYVALRREDIDRPLLTSRGVPEIARNWQTEVKVQRDSRVDLTSMKTMPPAEAPVSMAKLKLRFGPGAVNYTRSIGALRFMEMPQFPSESVEVENAIRNDVARYFGQLSEVVPAPEALLFDQDLADGWLLSIRACMRQTVALMRQFLSEEEAQRVAGGDFGRPWVAEREELQGQFDLQLTFDARDLDPDFAMAKMKLISELVLPADTAGVIDRAALTKWKMQSIDAHLADEVVTPMEAVTQREVEDEQVQLTKIVAGIEPPMKEAGQNAQLRLQVLENAIQSNPELMQRYEQDEGVFRQLVDSRMQHFRFLLQQDQNKQIGRVGAGKVLG